MDQYGPLFRKMLEGIGMLPYADQEQSALGIKFQIDDFVKRFPPAAIGTYQYLFHPLQDALPFSFKDRSVLEIGPGYNLGVLFLAGICGADRLTALEAFDHPMGPVHDFVSSMYEHLLKDRTFLLADGNGLSEQALTERFTRFLVKTADDKFAFNGDRVKVVTAFADRTPFADGAFGFVYSAATAEHFRNVGATVAELARITAPGGIHCHGVDFRDHRDFDRPLDSLTFSDDAWEELHRGRPGYSYTNRCRSSELVALFESSGLSLVKRVVTMRATVDDALVARFAPRFRDLPRDVLEEVSSVLVFRKTDGSGA